MVPLVSGHSRYIVMEDNVFTLLTSAEEGGMGKIVLLDKGAYKEMDICLM